MGTMQELTSDSSETSETQNRWLIQSCSKCLDSAEAEPHQSQTPTFCPTTEDLQFSKFSATAKESWEGAVPSHKVWFTCFAC
ncbi:hypothetical protein DV515_00007208 [Chloebia gouldiae]|uniref:Uncharacterized protein n=1 Tax=Chloebia gouldiae TaxID=44316 RepID=A0A3L8SJ98_CHLGU|nr:hypothetical protein DV515_00007208 [Chloebia gouldiae]